MTANRAIKEPQLICIIGAESTGKTTLARILAAHFDCPWVPEYLREFCDTHARTPAAGEQSLILETQHMAELTAQHCAAQRESPFVFCDTAPLLTAIYSDFIFGDPSLYGRARALHSRYALTLLLATDLAWVADGLQRDGEQVREPITQMIHHELDKLAAPFVTIIGQGEDRISSAIEALSLNNRRGNFDGVCSKAFKTS
jgi:nicotinamide riboside kinase